MMESNIKLAIFDLDGTLFDTREVNYFAYKDAIEKFGFTLEYDFFCNKCNGLFYKQFLPEIIGDDEKIMEIIHREKKQLYQHYLNKAKKNEKLFQLARMMKNQGIKLSLVTTASKQNTKEILQAFSEGETFDLILTREDVINSKPDPEGFIRAMNYFKISPKATIIFEDSEPGINAAHNSGAQYFRVYGFA